MFCKICMQKVIDKLLAEDLIILEYLEEKGAQLSQCSMSRSIIKKDLNLTEYKCYTALERLELFDFVAQSSKSKSNKYFITEYGKNILKIMETKMNGSD